MDVELAVQEEKILRAFQRQVDRLRKSSIVRQQQVTITTTCRLDFATGKRALSFSGYDVESFQSQLPILRQFILQQDQISFYRVCNIVLRRCQRDELKEWAREAKRLWKECLQRVPDMRSRTLFGGAASLDDALKNLFYGFGGLFHVDIDKPDEEASVAAIEAALIHYSFPDLWRCLNIMDSAIWWWLDETNAIVPRVEEVNKEHMASSDCHTEDAGR